MKYSLYSRLKLNLENNMTVKAATTPKAAKASTPAPKQSLKDIRANLAQLKAAEEAAEAEAALNAVPHMIVHVTMNNNVPINTKNNLGFTLNDERYGTVTLAKLIKIENHGLPVVMSTPTGKTITSDMYDSIQAQMNLTCFAQVPMAVFGSAKINGAKLLKIRLESALNLTTIQALDKNEAGENCSVFIDKDAELVHLTQEQLALGIPKDLTPKFTLLATVLFNDEIDLEEHFNPQQSQFQLAISSDEDLLAQLVSDSSFNAAKDAKGLVMWSASRPAINSMEDLDSTVDQIMNDESKALLATAK